jgi:hypothetical protein
MLRTASSSSATRQLLGLSALVLAGLPLHAAEPPKVAQLPIVERSIAFHGGEAYHRARVELSLCSLSGCFELRAQNDGARFDYIVTGLAGGKQRKVHWSNDTVEQWLEGVATPLDERTRQAAQDFVSARVYFPFLPFRLADPSASKQDLGLERWGARELHKVKVTFAAGSSTDAGDEYLYWFDPKTGRLEQFAYSFGTGANAGLRFRRGQNYREVGGILFFDQENLALDAPGLKVEQITPNFVATQMKKLSVVELREIVVKPAG